MTALNHAPFLAAVLAEPHNDAPRLGYADWLEETGDPELAARGTFIRVQCELARGPWHGSAEDPLDSVRFNTLRRREADLLGPNWPAWCGSEWAARCHCENLWPAPPCPTPSIAFRRGFVAEVTLTCAEWIGGPCRRCRGTDRAMHLHESPWRPDPSRPYPHGTGGQTTTFTECPACSGTGRTQGVGPALVRAAPLKRVALSDKRPEVHTPPGGPPNYSWYAAGFDDDAATLPAELFDRLPGGVSSFSAQRRAYPSEAAALDDLDRAARAWARSVEPATKEG